MAKADSLWTDKSGNSIAVQVSGSLLLEDGVSHLLLENGSKLLLEDISMNPKEATVWTDS